MRATTRLLAGSLVLTALAGCAADEASEDVAGRIAEAAETGPYAVGDTIPAGEEQPAEARRDVAEQLAVEHDQDFVWVTDAYVIAQGGEVTQAYYAVDGTGPASERLRDEWRFFDDPDAALVYAEEVAADVAEPERYTVVPHTD